MIAAPIDKKRPAMTYEDWWWRTHTIGWLKTLCQSYETEHDFESDEDTSATWEMLREVMGIHDKLLADLGDAPSRPETVPADRTIPF